MEPLHEALGLVRADNELRMRVIRAEKAANGAVKALMRYVKATNDWFEAAKAKDSDAVDAALKGLLEAHNAALAWAREEAERVRERRPG